MSIILSENETNSVFACSGRQSDIIVVMKRNTFEKRMAGAVLVAAALLLMVDWSPKMGETTRIVGQFAKDAPDSVPLCLLGGQPCPVHNPGELQDCREQCFREVPVWR